MSSDTWPGPYPRPVGRFTVEEEVAVAKRIEAGVLAAAMADGADSSDLVRSDATPGDLELLVRDGALATEQLLASYERLAYRFANLESIGSGVPVEDLAQEAREVMAAAVPTYDYTVGTFSGYVWPRVAYRVKEVAATKDRAENLPVWAARRTNQVHAIADRIASEQGRPATDEQVSAEVQMPAQTVRRLRAHNSPIPTGEFDRDIASPQAVADSDLPEELAYRMETRLTDEQRRLVALRYGLAGQEPHTDVAISQVTGYSTKTVARRISEAIEVLKSDSQTATVAKPEMTVQQRHMLPIIEKAAKSGLSLSEAALMAKSGMTAAHQTCEVAGRTDLLVTFTRRDLVMTATPPEGVADKAPRVKPRPAHPDPLVENAIVNLKRCDQLMAQARFASTSPETGSTFAQAGSCLIAANLPSLTAGQLQAVVAELPSSPSMTDMGRRQALIMLKTAQQAGTGTAADIPRNTPPDPSVGVVNRARDAVTEVMDVDRSAAMRRDAGLPTLAQVRRKAVDAVVTCDQAGLASQLDEALLSSKGPDGVTQVEHLRYQASLRPAPTPRTVKMRDERKGVTPSAPFERIKL